MTDTKWVWMDLETTGLSARDDVILEFAVVITDEFGVPYADFTGLVKDETYTWEERVEEVMTASTKPDVFVRNMHIENNLWNELETEDSYSTADAEYEIIKFLSANGVTSGSSPLFGSSIGSLDRPFILSKMPHLNEFLSYRNMDNSSIKILCEKHRTDLAKKLSHRYRDWGETQTSTPHRALYDTHASIMEYRFYLDNFFDLDDSNG